MYKDKWNEGKWKFFDKHLLGYPYYHIHPYKQSIVKQIIDNVPEGVTHVIVFGSAVHTWHKWWKDLDICFIGGSPKQLYAALPKNDEHSFDVLDYASIDSLFDRSSAQSDVRNQIIEEGVLVYEKV